jgi:plastocyanin
MLASLAPVAAALTLALPASAGPMAEDTVRIDHRVAVRDNFFSPRSLTLDPGDAVKWTWKGDNRHNILFKKAPTGASKKSAGARREGAWSRTFRKPGHYRYVCTLFAGMRGSVTVEEVEEEPLGKAADGQWSFSERSPGNGEAPGPPG